MKLNTLKKHVLIGSAYLDIDNPCRNQHLHAHDDKCRHQPEQPVAAQNVQPENGYPEQTPA
ncbi:hypothetical protein [Bacteroides acidifaciens]|uniref:hypothetical protein n=1 Tax=Bacteroides acidifaciens TaxID=85831 RepID=UPI003014ED99